MAKRILAVLSIVVIVTSMYCFALSEEKSVGIGESLQKYGETFLLSSYYRYKSGMELSESEINSSYECCVVWFAGSISRYTYNGNGNTKNFMIENASDLLAGLCQLRVNYEQNKISQEEYIQQLFDKYAWWVLKKYVK